MKLIRLLLLSALTALVLNGCAEHVGFHSAHLGFHTHPEEAQPSTIPTYGWQPLQYTIYYGSDAKHHYFESQHDLKFERYMVPRASLPWSPVFPVGKGRLYVERDASGTLRPIMPVDRPR